MKINLKILMWMKNKKRQLLICKKTIRLRNQEDKIIQKHKKMMNKYMNLTTMKTFKKSQKLQIKDQKMIKRWKRLLKTIMMMLLDMRKIKITIRILNWITLDLTVLMLM